MSRGTARTGRSTSTSSDDDLVDGIDDFDIVDESYADLRLGAGSRVLASHTLDGVRHPLVWLRQIGAGTVVVDLLGHDAASYQSAEHRELLGRAHPMGPLAARRSALGRPSAAC